MMGVEQYVCGIVISGSAVLMLRKSRPEWQEGRLNFPGGKVERGETLLQAMLREGREELGPALAEEIRDWRYLAAEQGPGYEVGFFVGHLDPAMIQVTPLKNDVGEVFSWHPVTALPNSVIGNCRWLVPLALDPRAEVRAEITVAGEISQMPTWMPDGRPSVSLLSRTRASQGGSHT